MTCYECGGPTEPVSPDHCRTCYEAGASRRMGAGVTYTTAVATKPDRWNGDDPRPVGVILREAAEQWFGDRGIAPVRWVDVDLDPSLHCRCVRCGLVPAAYADSRLCGPCQTSVWAAQEPGTPRSSAASRFQGMLLAREMLSAPPPFTLADVLRIAEQAAHSVNPHIAVCVDNMTRAGGRQWLVWLSLAGRRAGAVLLETCPPDEASETLRATALLVCLNIGRAYRPGAR